VAIFLDIEGAFNNASLQSIIDALVKRGVASSICNWIKAMLKEWIVKTTSRRCPQGGVLSPLLWALVVDDLLDLLTKAGFEVQGYAVDLVIIIRGKYGSVISDRVQLALDRDTRWCLKEGLSVNPLKTSIIPFTKKLNLGDLRTPTMNSEVIEFKTETKYLEVILDKPLTWNAHLKRMSEKANLSWWQCSKLCGKNWGLRPKMLHYLYTTVVRPASAYACQVWWPKVKQAGARLELQRIQRTPCMSITGAFKTTPSAALEALLNLPLLDLFMEGEARNSSYRLICLEQNNLKNMWFDKSHPQIFHELNNNFILGMPLDLVVPKFNFNISFTTNIPSLDEWMSTSHAFINGDVVWYTDGSETVSGISAGAYCYSLHKEISCSLGNYSTVFQAELYAIEMCAYECIQMGISGNTILILSDSQAAIKALISYRIRSKMVWSCLRALSCLGSVNQVLITWIPGHKGFEGNIKADFLAKKGAAEKLIGPEPAVGVALNSAKTFNKTWVMD
jgi:ribonuclease HI